MGSFGNTMANFGLTAQGMDTSRQVNQNYDIGTEQLAGAKQNNELRSQQVQAGRMGLEDATRARNDAASIRTAGQRGAQAGGVSGSLDEMALAAEQAGDVNKALGFRQLKSQLAKSGVVDAIHAVSMDDRAGARPDVEDALIKSGNRNFTPGTLQFDGKGTISFVGKDGQPGTINVPVVAERLGVVPKRETQVLRPGERMVDKGKGTMLAENPAHEARKGFDMGKITNNGVEYSVSFNRDTGEASVLNPDGSPVPTKTTVHTDSQGQTIITIDGKPFTMTPGTPGTPGKKNWFSADVPATPGTPPRLAPIATPEAPPIGGAQKAPDGNWYVKKGDKWAPVIVNGAPGAPGATPQPAAAPAQKPTPAPAAAPTTTPVANVTTDDIPEVAGAPMEKQTVGQKREAFATKRASEKESAAKQKIVKTFRDLSRLPKMSAADAPIIEDALKTGLLTPAETDKANRMLARLKPQTAER